MNTAVSANPQGAIDAQEWQLRVDLAACYRIFDYLGWTELIFNHISLRIPGPEHHFLINPFGLWYKEVTASNLVKIDLEGDVISGDYPVNRAGFVIHSAIHAAREDAHCVMHTHTTETMAIACQKDGLLTENFYSAFLHDQLAYHDFEGLTVYEGERERLVQSLGNKNLMLLRNHGPLTVGSTVQEAFMRLWTLQRACEVQLAAQSAGAALLSVTASAVNASQQGANGSNEDTQPINSMVFDALRREIDRVDPSYQN